MGGAGRGKGGSGGKGGGGGKGNKGNKGGGGRGAGGGGGDAPRPPQHHGHPHGAQKSSMQPAAEGKASGGNAVGMPFMIPLGLKMSGDGAGQLIEKLDQEGGLKPFNAFVLKMKKGPLLLLGNRQQLHHAHQALIRGTGRSIQFRSGAGESCAADKLAGSGFVSISAVVVHPVWQKPFANNSAIDKFAKSHGITISTSGSTHTAKTLVLKGTRSACRDAYREIQSLADAYVVSLKEHGLSTKAAERNLRVSNVEPILRAHLTQESIDEHIRPEEALSDALGASSCQDTIRQLATNADNVQKTKKAQRLETFVRKVYPSAKIFVFGSTMTGLAEQNSDLDVACDIPVSGHERTKKDEERLVWNVFQQLRKTGQFRGLQAIPRARCPIIKNEPPPGSQDTMPFDLSFRLFGAVNSFLLHDYFTEPPMRVAGVVIKAWSKASGINNSRFGYLSSYAIILMFLHMAIQKGLVEWRNPADYLVPGRIPQFPPQFKNVVDGEALRHEVGGILCQFLRYYAQEFDWENEVVGIISGEARTKEQIGWKTAGDGGLSPLKNVQNYHLAIEDPYEQRDEGGLNCSRGVNVQNYLYIRLAFATKWKEVCAGDVRMHDANTVAGEARFLAKIDGISAEAADDDADEEDEEEEESEEKDHEHDRDLPVLDRKDTPVYRLDSAHFDDATLSSAPAAYSQSPIIGAPMQEPPLFAGMSADGLMGAAADLPALNDKDSDASHDGAGEVKTVHLCRTSDTASCPEVPPVELPAPHVAPSVPKTRMAVVAEKDHSDSEDEYFRPE